MNNTLELGRAGTEEWIAASQNLRLPADVYSGPSCYDGIATGTFLDETLMHASDYSTSCEPAQISK